MHVCSSILNKYVVAAFLIAGALSGCAAAPIATTAPASPNVPHVVIATKVPAPTLSASQVTTLLTETPTGTADANMGGMNMEMKPPPIFTVPDPAPTITPSGPILDPKTANAQSFNTNVPSTIGSLKRLNTKNLTSAYGAAMQFRTDNGAIYQVALWITPSAQDALTRYQVDTSQLSGKQPLKIGDEAILTTSSVILAEVRYRNMVLIVYRPTLQGIGSYKPLADDEITSFISTLFKAIPQS